MKHKLLAIFLVCLSLTGCSRVLMTVYGMKNPKPRDEAYLVRFLQKQGIETSHLYAYSFRKWGKTLSDGNNLRMPNILIFDKQGRYIPYSPDGAWICNSSAAPFIAQLADTASYHIDSSLTADAFLSDLHSLNGQQATYTLSEGTDYLVVVIWASFAGGRLARNNIPEWERQARENPHANIELIKLSFDPQAWWPEADTIQFSANGGIDFSR